MTFLVICMLPFHELFSFFIEKWFRLQAHDCNSKINLTKTAYTFCTLPNFFKSQNFVSLRQEIWRKCCSQNFWVTGGVATSAAENEFWAFELTEGRTAWLSDKAFLNICALFQMLCHFATAVLYSFEFMLWLRCNKVQILILTNWKS